MRKFILCLLLLVGQRCVAREAMEDIPALTKYLVAANNRALKFPLNKSEEELLVSGDNYLMGCIEAIFAAEALGVKSPIQLPDDIPFSKLRQDVEFVLLEYITKHPEVSGLNSMKVVVAALRKSFPVK